MGLLVALAIVGLMISSDNSSGTAMEHSTCKEKPAFNVDALPGLEEWVFRTEGKSWQYHKPHHESAKGAREDMNTHELPLPIIEADDNVLHGKSSIADHVVDILECRDSVINLVINAMDVKEECNGLKKAFDKTCNSNSVEENIANSATHPNVDLQR